MKLIELLTDINQLNEVRIYQPDWDRLINSLSHYADDMTDQRAKDYFLKKIPKLVIKNTNIHQGLYNDPAKFKTLDRREEDEANRRELVGLDYDIRSFHLFLSHQTDWLNSMIELGDDRGLNSIRGIQSIQQADDMAEKYFKKLNKKASEIEGRTKDLMNFKNNWKMIELLSNQALAREGKLMGHCVGSYCGNVDRGESRIFSLRDPKNMPHATLEYDMEDKAIIQIKGKGNEAPDKKYWNMIREFIKKKRLNVYDDASNIGLLNISIRTKRGNEKFLLLELDEFINLMEDPTKVLRINPKNIEEITVSGTLDLTGYPEDIDWFDKDLELNIQGDLYLTDSEIKTLPYVWVSGILYLENSSLDPEYLESGGFISDRRRITGGRRGEPRQ